MSGQMQSVGSSTQYTEGDVDATPIGNMTMFKGAGNAATAVSAATPLPVDLIPGQVGVAGGGGGVTSNTLRVTSATDSAEIVQGDTMLIYFASLENLLTLIQALLVSIETYESNIGADTANIVANTTPLLATIVAPAVRYEEVSATVTYIGEAQAGTAESGPAWRIKKMDTTSGIVITWADSTSAFDKIWDDRASYTYG